MTVSKIRDAYTDWASSYDSDRNRTRDLDLLATRETLERFRCRSILEIGCGTGKNTRLLAQLGDHVLALDFSGGMLEQAKAKVCLGNVSFGSADLTRIWPIQDASVDLIACNLVLEHIEDISFIFAEASRALITKGCFFVCELHPYRQYQGTVANFRRDEATTEIPAFVHHVSDFTRCAGTGGFAIRQLREWWHEEDSGKPPRLVSFLFEKVK